MTNGRVLKIASPRAIAWRCGEPEFVHPRNSVKTNGLRPPDDPAHEPGIDGSMSSGSLMPMQNGSRASVSGPLRAAPSVRLPAERSATCVANSPKLEIEDRVHLRGRGRYALRVTRDRVHHLRDQIRRESPDQASIGGRPT